MRRRFYLMLLVGFLNSFLINVHAQFWVKSTGKLPQLAYGIGSDRLGVAKLGIIDTGIILKVVDSVANQYKIQLSANRFAFIAKTSTTLPINYIPPSYYLTSSWSVKAKNENNDIVSIALDEKLPYSSWMNPTNQSVEVMLYGVQSNTNWITQLSSAKEVKSVFFEQIASDELKVTIVLKHKNFWGYHIQYSGKQLQVVVRVQPAQLKFKHLVIAVDAGHGGLNSGAIGLNTKILEKDYTLLFAKALTKYLRKKNIQVITTRDKDTTIDNTDRVIKLQQQLPDVLVSLHLNSSSNTNVKGTSTYYKHVAFRPLSVAILNEMLKADLNEFGNIGHFNFLLNAPTEFPNTLVEIAFLSNAADEQKILSTKFHKQVARRIYAGLKRWLAEIK